MGHKGQGTSIKPDLLGSIIRTSKWTERTDSCKLFCSVTHHVAMWTGRCRHSKYKNVKLQRRRKAQQLRTLTTLTEDQSSYPSTYKQCLTTAYSSRSRGTDGTVDTMYTDTCIHINKKNKSWLGMVVWAA